MLNILIKDSDMIFRRGMMYFLKEFYLMRFRCDVEFMTDYTPENIATADVIILSMCNGERYTCIPELRDRRKGIIIGLVDENDNGQKSPSCFGDIVYITRRESLEVLTQKIYIAWFKWVISNVFPQPPSCPDCNHRTLSLQQRDTMALFYEGLSIAQIATIKNMSYKTVATHKYLAMRKFNLDRDYDLLRFLDVFLKNDLKRRSYRKKGITGRDDR